MNTIKPTAGSNTNMYAANVTGVTNELDLGPADGIQLKFAKLLLKLSEACKGQANEYLKEVEGIQAKQKEVASMIEEARKMINYCGDNKTQNEPMPKVLAEYFAKENLKLGTPSRTSTSVPVHNQSTGESKSRTVHFYTKDQCEFNLKSLTNHQEQMGTKTQSLMVILQDFVGQYNANLTGAKTAITDFTDTLKTLMR